MKPKNIIAAIHLFNKNDIPFNRGLEQQGGAITSPKRKLELLKETILSYINSDPGIPLSQLIIVNQGTDCSMTQEFLQALNSIRTSYDTPILVLDAPDNLWPGPFGSRNFIYNSFPDYDYYFEADSDTMTIQTGWLKLLQDRMDNDPQIGLIGAYLDKTGFRAPDTVKWQTKEGIIAPPPIIKYSSGAFTYVPRHIYEGFTKYWGEKWINQGNCYYDYAATMGELYFAFKVDQLGYKNTDLADDVTDAPYDWIVPDRLFPNVTVGYTNTYPTKPFISPFYNTYLAMHDRKKVAWIQGHYQNCTKIVK